MDFDISNILRNSEYFSFLDESNIKNLSQECKVVTFEKDDIVFEKDQPSDCFYLVITGLLSAYLSVKKDEETTVGYINPGQIVGEMGVLANQPRALSVKALRHSALLKISHRVFDDYFVHDAALLTQFIKLILRRQTKTIQALVHKHDFSNILLMPANEDVDIKLFVDNLKNVIPKSLNVDYYNISDYLSFHHRLAELNNYFDTHEKLHDLAFFVVDKYDEEIIRFFYEHADRVVLVGHGNTQPDIAPMVNDVLHNLEYKFTKKTLVLLYQNNESPQHTNKWLSVADFAGYHHVKKDITDDYATLIRFFSGKALGVVLGGGGGLGWVHLGALKAMQDANLTIDMIGGTSIGAIVAGLYLCYPDQNDFQKAFTDIMKSIGHPITLRNLTYPIVSILSGKHGTLALQKVFGNKKIEDLNKPYFCITANSNKAKEVAHTQGLLWKWNRASGSVPWLLPPVVDDYDIHIDGGIMNNLPVDVMREYLDGKGKIIAVDLVGLALDSKKYSFPPIMPFWKSLLIKCTKNRSKYHFPDPYDALIRTIMLGSKHKLAENERLADILVKPKLDKFPALSDSNIAKANELIELGYEATIKELKLANIK